MPFKKGDKVTTASGGGIVYDDQQGDEVKVLITATDKVENFIVAEVKEDSSSGNTREVWD